MCLIEPGGVKTPIWDKGLSEADEFEASLSPEAKGNYGTLVAALRREVDRIATKTGMEPSEVADKIVHALTAKRPRTRYLIGSEARQRWAVAKCLPDRAFDGLIARSLR